MNINNNNNQSKKVKFSQEWENESKNNINQILKKNFSTNKKYSTEEEKDEMLLNKKRNFNNNNINPNTLKNQNQTISENNYLEQSDFKNPEKLYYYSCNKYSSSTIKKIDEYIIKQTPEKPQNSELDDSRFRGSDYKFSSGKKVITSIENPTGIKAFDNSFGVIENYYLEKRSVIDLANRSENSRCNFKISQAQKLLNVFENEGTPMFGNTKRNLNVSDLPNKLINFSEANIMCNNILNFEKIKENSDYEIFKFKDNFFNKNENNKIQSNKAKECSMVNLEKNNEESNSLNSRSQEEEFDYNVPKENNLELNENENEMKKLEESEFNNNNNNDEKEREKDKDKEELEAKNQKNIFVNKSSLNLLTEKEEIPVLINIENNKINDAFIFPHLNNKEEQINVLEIASEKEENKKTPDAIFNQQKVNEESENDFNDHKIQIKEEENKNNADNYNEFATNKKNDEMEIDSQMEIPKANDFYMQSNSDFPEEEQESEDIGLLKCKQAQSSKSLQESNRQRKESNFGVIDLISEENNFNNDDKNNNNNDNNFKSDLSVENEKARLESKILGVRSGSVNYSRNEFNNNDYEVIESSDNLLNKSFIEESNTGNEGEFVNNKNNNNNPEDEEININFDDDNNNNCEYTKKNDFRSLQDILAMPPQASKTSFTGGKDNNKVKKEAEEVVNLIESFDENQENKNEINLNVVDYKKDFANDNDNRNSYAFDNLENKNQNQNKNEQEESVFSNYQLEQLEAQQDAKENIHLNKETKYELVIQAGPEVYNQQSNNNNKIYNYQNYAVDQNNNADDSRIIINQKDENQNLIQIPADAGFDYTNNNNNNNCNNIEKNNQENLFSEAYINQAKQQYYYEYPKFDENTLEDNNEKYFFKNIYSYNKKKQINKRDLINQNDNKDRRNLISINENEDFNENNNNNNDNYYTNQAYQQKLYPNLQKSNQDYYLNLNQDANLFVNNFADANINIDSNNYYNNDFDNIENGINPLQKFEQYLKINSKNTANGKKRRRRNWYLFSSNKLNYIQHKDFNMNEKKISGNLNAANKNEIIKNFEIKEEYENERRIVKELEETLLSCVISKVMKQNNIDENFIEELDVFKNYSKNQLNFCSLKNFLIDQNLISQHKLESLLNKLNLSSSTYNQQTKYLNLKKLLLGAILFFAFFVVLKLFGIRLSDFANLIKKIPFTKILIIFCATILIAFLTYSLVKISGEIQKQNNKQITIARKTQEIISLYLNKLKEYDFSKFYIENNFLIERIAKRLKVSKQYFERKIMQYVKKENPEYRFISYVDSQGKENAFWRLKNY